MANVSENGLNTKNVPALVIGSGISGLFTALKLSKVGIRVLLITKTSLDENNSRYAQGGIAAVLPDNSDDSLELHLKDTLAAGAGLCDEGVVRSILSEGFDSIEDLLTFGVPFDRNISGNIALTLEGGHSTRRILHAGGDATGEKVEMALIERVHADPLIEVMEHVQVTELLSAANSCYGCRAIDLINRQEWMILSQFTVLATGGVGRLFAQTTNPSGATGNGISLAYQAGAILKDIEFIQFHPTAFYTDGKVQFLVTEALRGEGGILRNAEGYAFAKDYDPKGELAPRDVVTRAIYSEIQKQRQAKSPVENVFLDISHLSGALIEERFPTILRNCQAFGVDIRKDLIPVSPAAHYIMGGALVDDEARTTVEGLYAVGETVYTGLHGANRLASNSLLECCVLARRAAEHIIGEYTEELTLVPPEPLDFNPKPYVYTKASEIPERLTTLRQLMWDLVGLVRDDGGLREAVARIEALETEAYGSKWAWEVPKGVEYLNQLLLSRLITEAALARRESRGSHFRSDYPDRSSNIEHSTQSQHLLATVG